MADIHVIILIILDISRCNPFPQKLAIQVKRSFPRHYGLKTKGVIWAAKVVGYRESPWLAGPTALPLLCMWDTH